MTLQQWLRTPVFNGLLVLSVFLLVLGLLVSVITRSWRLALLTLGSVVGLFVLGMILVMLHQRVAL